MCYSFAQGGPRAIRSPSCNLCVLCVVCGEYIRSLDFRFSDVLTRSTGYKGLTVNIIQERSQYSRELGHQSEQVHLCTIMGPLPVT